MKKSEEPQTRGLTAVKESRQRRLEFPRIPPRYILWVLLAIAVWAIIYWKIEQGKLESWRNKLLADQRAVAFELSPRYNPVRDQLEAWIIDASGTYPGDFVSPDIRPHPEEQKPDFRSQPGVYLRLYIDDAKQVDTIRSAALDSLRDGFTSCFTTYPNKDPFQGSVCKKNSDCAQHEHCNEVFRCSEPAQPYNLRIAYRAARVLSDEWVKEVRDAGSDMRLRLLDRDFRSAVDEDIPLTIELLQRGRYFLLVIDENAENQEDVPDAGTYCESLQAVQHPVRVLAWDLVSRKLLFRVRTDLEGRTILRVQTDAETPEDARVGVVGVDNAGPGIAVRRQSNNCAIAVEVRGRIFGDSGE